MPEYTNKAGFIKVETIYKLSQVGDYTWVVLLHLKMVDLVNTQIAIYVYPVCRHNTIV